MTPALGPSEKQGFVSLLNRESREGQVLMTTLLVASRPAHFSAQRKPLLTPSTELCDAGFRMNVSVYLYKSLGGDGAKVRFNHS